MTYRDQNTPIVTYDEDWQNNRQKAKVTVVKKEKNTDRVLEGGVFALYTKNDILNAEGEVILKADTMIEQKATDQDGRIVFTADLPINGSYYVKEVQAPAGFVTTEEIKEFDFTYAGEEVQKYPLSSLMKMSQLLLKSQNQILQPGKNYQVQN